MKTLADGIAKITVLNTTTGEEIAVINDEIDTPIITASPDIVVKITPKQD